MRGKLHHTIVELLIHTCIDDSLSVKTRFRYSVENVMGATPHRFLRNTQISSQHRNPENNLLQIWLHPHHSFKQIGCKTKHTIGENYRLDIVEMTIGTLERSTNKFTADNV